MEASGLTDTARRSEPHRVLLKQVASKTELPSTVLQDAEAILEKAICASLHKGRAAAAIVASSLILASNKNGAGLSPDEVAVAVRSTEYSVVARDVQKTIRSMAQELKMGPEYVYSKPVSYVHRILDRLGIDDEGFEKEVLRLVSSLDRLKFQGYNPLSIAGASIYIAGREKGLSQRDVAKCCFVSRVTLRNATKRVQESLGQ